VGDAAHLLRHTPAGFAEGGPDRMAPERRQGLVVLGAGGHGRTVVELIRDLDAHEVVGVVDARPPESGQVLGIPILGTEAALPGLRAGGVGLACVAIGDPTARLEAAARLEAMGFVLPPLVHPSTLRASSASVAEGAVVLPRAVLGALARIGRLAIVTTGAIVEHDAVVEEGALIGPGAVLPGGVQVGARAQIGAGAACRPYVRIGAGAVVGVGAAVVEDVPDGARVGGVPARPLRRRG
jgi:UDP-perosamine 4-acetyltransferase